MKKIKTIGLLTLMSVFCSLFSVLPVSAGEVTAPMILDAYSMTSNQEKEVYISGLVMDGLDVLIYIDGDYKGLANISQKEEKVNPFSFSATVKKSNKSLNISAISKDRSSAVLSTPTHARDRKVSKPRPSKPSLFLASSTTAVLSTSTQEATATTTTPTKVNSVKTVEAPNTTPPPAPTLIGPNLEDVVGTPKPLILGLSKSGTIVHVYIDGVYNGKTPVLEDKSGTASFAYRPFLNLEVGRHQVITIAENLEGQKSPISKMLYFTVEDRMVSPTISTLGQTAFKKQNGLSLVGWAKNNSLVKVFVDHFLDDEFKVENDASGTANFVYNSPKTIDRGSHLVYATAIDERGKESPWSNIIYFTIYEPKIATSSSETASSSVLGTRMDVSDSDENDALAVSENVIKTKELGNAKGISEENGQNIKITKESQNIRLNIIIFVLFLVAIAIWMILVNRELVKEKQEVEKKDS